MSGLDLAVIRGALVDQLRTIDGLFVYPQWPGTPQIFPCIVVFPPDNVDYSKTMNRALDMATWELLALAGPMSPVSQQTLEGLMSGTGDLSVISCLYEDRKLGQLVSNLRVTGITSGIYAVSRSGGDDVIGCEITTEITA
jgi:hypothetical protein